MNVYAYAFLFPVVSLSAVGLGYLALSAVFQPLIGQAKGEPDEYWARCRNRWRKRIEVLGSLFFAGVAFGLLGLFFELIGFSRGVLPDDVDRPGIGPFEY